MVSPLLSDPRSANRTSPTVNVDDSLTSHFIYFKALKDLLVSGEASLKFFQACSFKTAAEQIPEDIFCACLQPKRFRDLVYKDLHGFPTEMWKTVYTQIFSDVLNGTF